MYDAIDIFRKLVVPVLGSVCLVLLKKLADRRRPSLGDASDLAWYLMMMSFGAMIVSSRGWTDLEYKRKIVMDIFLAFLLIANRRRRQRTLDVILVSCGPSYLARIVESGGEILIGVTAVLLTSA